MTSPLRWWQYLTMVAWSFFGIRRGQAAQRELEGFRPWLLLVTAIGLAGTFVGLLLLAATWATKAFGT